MCPELPGNGLGFFQFANCSLPPSREHRSPISSRSPYIKLQAQAQLPAVATSYSIHVPCELTVPCASASSSTTFSPLHPSETSTLVEPRQLKRSGSSIRDIHDASAVLHPPRCLSKHEIDVSRPRHQSDCGIHVGAARQTRKDHHRSR